MIHEMGNTNKIRLLVLTGLSGSGKTSAMHALEDRGYFCVDNMPIVLLPGLLDLLLGSDPPLERLAVVMDIREGRFLEKHEQVFQTVRASGVKPEILFLEAETEILLRRFEETRRPHPLARDRTLLAGIEAERDQLSGVRRLADRIIDTSFFNIHQIRQYLHLLYGGAECQEKKLQVELISFSYARGIPLQADLIMDVRFLPNPHYNPELRERDGREAEIQEAVQAETESKEILDALIRWVVAMVDFYEKEDRAYFKMGFGCTGGKHRSVAVLSLLEGRLQDRGYTPKVLHRDIIDGETGARGVTP